LQHRSKEYDKKCVCSAKVSNILIYSYSSTSGNNEDDKNWLHCWCRLEQYPEQEHNWLEMMLLFNEMFVPCFCFMLLWKAIDDWRPTAIRDQSTVISYEKRRVTLRSRKFWASLFQVTRGIIKPSRGTFYALTVLLRLPVVVVVVAVS
jgi:hypothetical protein